MNINDKVAVVTGGIRGIGLSIVQQLLRRHAKYVAILDVHQSDSPLVVNNLQYLGREFNQERFAYYCCDVVNNEQFIASYENVLEKYSYVDILVNNAGVSSEKNVDRMIDVNFKALVKCTLTAIDYMGKQNGGKDGVIVNIGSFLGLVNTSSSPIYCATKHAVVSFVRSMKDHNKSLGVRVLCICPGMTKTDMTTVNNLQTGLLDFIDPSYMNQHLSVYLQKPDNVASAVAEIIERGKEGSVWLAQNEQAPFAVKDVESLEELRIPF